MECKHGLDTRWCGVCIHGPRRERQPRQPSPNREVPRLGAGKASAGRRRRAATDRRYC